MSREFVKLDQFYCRLKQCIQQLAQSYIMAQIAKEQNENISEFNKFLQNNNELLLEKYREYFVIDSLPIKSVDPNMVVKFINDIFSFDRYEDKEVKEKLSTSLKDNYKQFIDKNKNIQQFTSKISIDLLKFCIQNNKMFAVKYEKQLSKDLQSPKKQNNQHDRQQLQKMENQLAINRRQVDSAMDSNQNKSHITNQFAEEGLKRLNSFMENQFEFHQDIKYDFDPVLINKNIVTVFQYYCKQQMALKPNLSFERIEEQSKTLTLSKLLLMARMLNILNSIITKQVLTSKFRAVSEGKTRIDLKKFQIMFNQLQILDPTLIARAQLNSPNIQVHLKTTKKPFDTQDTSPRQLIKNRPFIHKLTMHSGKTQQDLIAQLQSKRSQMLPERYQKIKKYEEIIADARARYRNHIESSIFSTKKLVSNSKKISADLSAGMMKHILNEKDDQKYLQEYKIKVPPKRRRSMIRQNSDRSQNMIKQLKNRIKEIEKTELQSSNNMEQTRPYLYSASPKRF